MQTLAPTEKMHSSTIAFMKGQTVLTIATSLDGVPHCATCFYVFDEVHNFLVFKSKAKTKHVQQALENSQIAGSILPDKFIPAKTSGIQFNGTFCKDDKATHPYAAHHYYKKYPFAAAMPGELWIIELSKVIFTDATLGFGKRRVWEKFVPEVIVED